MEVVENGNRVIGHVPIDKGWLPDLIPHRMPPGGLLATSNIIPTVDGYKPDTSYVRYGAQDTTELPLRAKTFIHSDGTAYTVFGAEIFTCLIRPDKTIVNVSKSGNFKTSTDWHFEQYGDWLIATNFADTVSVLKDFASATNFVALGGSPGYARYVLFDNGHLILANIKDVTEYVTNGTFTGSAASWTLAGNCAYGTNNVAKTTGSTGSLTQTVALTAGQTYEVSFNLTSNTGTGNLSVTYNSVTIATLNTATIGTTYGASIIFNPAASGDLVLSAASANVWTIDNVSIKTYRGKTLKWSALENVEDWTASLTTGSDSQDFPDLKGDIVGIEKLPNGFAFFSSGGSIVNGYYSGGVFTFNFTWQLPDRGCLKNSFISAKGGIYFWSKRDICFYDGQTAVSIGQGVRKTIFGTDATYGLSRANASNIHGWYDAEFQLLYWAYPISATVLNLICYSIERQIWTFVGAFTVNIFFLMYDDGNVNNIPELAYTSGPEAGAYVVKSRIDGTLDTSAAQLTVGELWMPDFGVYQLDRVRPRVNANTAALTVTVGSRMNENDSVTSAPTAPLPVSGSSGWVDRRATGRYFRVTTTLGGGEIGDLAVSLTKVGDR